MHDPQDAGSVAFVQALILRGETVDDERVDHDGFSLEGSKGLGHLVPVHKRMVANRADDLTWQVLGLRSSWKADRPVSWRNGGAQASYAVFVNDRPIDYRKVRLKLTAGSLF